VTLNRLFSVFFAALLAAGAWLGYWLSSFPKLDTVKLLAVLGISYQLLGIVVLSETISTSERLKKFVVNWLSGILIWAHTIVPLGIWITALALFLAELSRLVEPGSFRTNPGASRGEFYALFLLTRNFCSQLRLRSKG